MRIQTLERKMSFPVSLQEAFAVFGNPGNLAKITPKVAAPSHIPRIAGGGVVRYDKHG